MGLYQRYVLPHIIQCCCGSAMIDGQRATVAPLARGRVLELGFGQGHNLPFYDKSAVQSVVGVEPAHEMTRMAKRRIAQAPFAVEIVHEKAEETRFPPGSFDTVIVTYSLCTIDDPKTALEAARRALKPSGQLLFVEHGLAPDTNVARFQRRFEPFWKMCGGGCRLTRVPDQIIEAAGFSIDSVERGYLEGMPRWAGYQVLGTAKPR